MLNIADAKTATKLLPHLAAFVAVVEAGSYSAAARSLGIDKTLLSRRVSTLEDRLGVRLLQRTTRRLSPTEAGRLLFERSMSPLNETVAALSVAADPQRLEGVVRIATFSSLTAPLWVPVLGRLREQHPELTIDLRANERFVDLVGEGIDFAVRSGKMPDSTYSARRVCSWQYVLVAAPSWLAKHQDTVRSPRDIGEHWVLYQAIPRANRWTFRRGDESLELETGAIALSDSGEVIERLLLAGFGVAAMPSFAVADPIADGRLVRVLPEWSVAHGHGLWIVTPARDHVPARVSLVIEAVCAKLESLAETWRQVVETS